MAPEVPQVFLVWEAFLGWLLDQTAKFPRDVRHTLTNRIDNLALDVYEGIVEARYTRERHSILRRANLNLEKLRLLLRLAHTRRHLSHGAHERAQREIDTAGRMIGGWERQQAQGAVT